MALRRLSVYYRATMVGDNDRDICLDAQLGFATEGGSRSLFQHAVRTPAAAAPQISLCRSVEEQFAALAAEEAKLRAKLAEQAHEIIQVRHGCHPQPGERIGFRDQ